MLHRTIVTVCFTEKLVQLPNTAFKVSRHIPLISDTLVLHKCVYYMYFILSYLYLELIYVAWIDFLPCILPTLVLKGECFERKTYKCCMKDWCTYIDMFLSGFSHRCSRSNCSYWLKCNTSFLSCRNNDSGTLFYVYLKLLNQIKPVFPNLSEPKHIFHISNTPKQICHKKLIYLNIFTIVTKSCYF